MENNILTESDIANTNLASKGILVRLSIKKWSGVKTSKKVAEQIAVDHDVYQLPHILDVSCQFLPIHDFIPRKHIFNSPFIGRYFCDIASNKSSIFIDFISGQFALVLLEFNIQSSIRSKA